MLATSRQCLKEIQNISQLYFCIAEMIFLFMSDPRPHRLKCVLFVAVVLEDVAFNLCSVSLLFSTFFRNMHITLFFCCGSCVLSCKKLTPFYSYEEFE